MEEFYGKIIFDNDWDKKFKELNEKGINLQENNISIDSEADNQNYPGSESVLNKIEDIEKEVLDVKNGQKLAFSKKIVAGYDESIQSFSGLEGLGNLIAYSLLIIKDNFYIPIVYVEFNFFTRSQKYAEESKTIIRPEDSPNLETAIKKRYILTRNNFLLNQVEKIKSDDNSILFIDGPLIGGNLSHYTIDLDEKLRPEKIIPIYFVKNSNSNLVVDNYDVLKGKFNSDLDWAHKTLKMGERSSFFEYEDKKNQNYRKVFCYLKTTPSTVQRVEFSEETYKQNKDNIKNIMDLIYYFIVLQGSYVNPQVRPIAIAEMYARETLKKVRTTKFKELKITPTMNEIRFRRENLWKIE